MSRPSERSLGDYVQFARRNIVLITIFVLLGLAGGAYVQLQSHKSFTATASVLLAPVPTYVSLVASGPAPSQITIDTDARLLRYEQTLNRVAAATGEDRATVAKRLNVTAPTSTRVLKVSYTAPDRYAATVGAATAAAALLDTRRELLSSLQSDQIDRLTETIRETQADIDKLSGNVIGAVHRQELLAQIAVLTDRRDSLAAARLKPGEIIAAPSPPPTSDRTYPSLPIGSGAMVGLLIGIALSIVHDGLRSQRSPSILSTSSPNR